MLAYNGNLIAVAGLDLASVPVTLAGTGPRIPAGTVLRGANVTLYNDTGVGFWQNWNWPYVKSQIDNAASLGVNCIRLTGSIRAVYEATVTQTVYNTEWAQALDYIAGKGMWVYPCGGGVLTAWAGNSAALTGIAGIFRSWAGLLNEYSNVIGIDLTNEIFDVFGSGADPAPILQMVATWGAAVRAVTTLPVTQDRTCHTAYRWSGVQGQLLDPYIDFVDVHSYYTQAPADVMPLFTQPWGRKAVILGEFGAALDLTGPDRAARYTAAAGLVTSYPQFAGAFAWALHDVTDDPANQWGLFDPAGAPRTAISTVLSTFPTSR